MQFAKILQPWFIYIAQQLEKHKGSIYVVIQIAGRVDTLCINYLMCGNQTNWKLLLCSNKNIA